MKITAHSPKKTLIRFRRDERGVFAVVFGVLAIVLVAMGGAVVDFVNVQNARGMAQSSLDATTLALQPKINTLSETEILDQAQLLLNERMAVINLSAAIETVTKDTNEGTLFIEARFSVPTYFLTLVGIPNLQTRVHSEVTSKSVNIEVALVLDSTASMTGAKLTALKVSANLLVDELMPNAENPNLKISIVPFNRYVNIGMPNRNEPGLDIEPDYDWTPAGEYCYNTYPNSTYQCDSNWESYSCTIDGVASTCWRWVYTNCTGSYGAPVEVCVPQGTRHFRWYGCMGSRHLAPLDTQDDTYIANEVPGIMRHWNSCRVTPLTELSSTKADVQSGIEAMTAQDNTYIPTGLMWGWRLLSPGIPFTSASAYGPQNKKVLILMTDGQNTISPSTAWTEHEPGNHRVHRGANTNEANTKTAEICANIKDEDIVVYTIAFDVTDATIRTILENCAGNGGAYFDASDASELEEAFINIADDLKVLRVSR